jgi:GT2 family glycosyltransferase
MKNFVKGKFPFVSVIIPCLNEEKYIRRCLISILENDYPKDKLEIIVVDGGSTDGTTKIVKELARKHSNIKLLGRAGVNCPSAMNIGIKKAKGDIISKVDAHGYVDSDFLKINVKYLCENKDIKCTGGPIRQLGESFIAKANAYARISVFGVGRGIYSIEENPRFVDTVQCGTYSKEIFNEIGLFDELLQYGEDEELNWRIRKAGYKILCTPEIKFFYYARTSLKGLFRQYYHYGNARVKVIRKHPDFLRIKHLIPSAFVFSLGCSLIVSIFYTLFLWLFGVIVVCYLGSSAFFSYKIALRKGKRYFFILPIVFGVLHISYGLGFLIGLIRFIKRWKK